MAAVWHGDARLDGPLQAPRNPLSGSGNANCLSHLLARFSTGARRIHPFIARCSGAHANAGAVDGGFLPPMTCRGTEGTEGQRPIPGGEGAHLGIPTLGLGCETQEPSARAIGIWSRYAQAFFAAVSTCSRPCLPSPGGRMVPQPSGGGPLPLVDCSGFFYTDPTLPPGYRIYNCLSASSQEVLRSLPLNTPAPIMCPCPAAAAGRRWLSDPECRAVSALLALPASGGGNASSGPAPGAAAACGETDATASCP
ncbi:UNVERIFIED_CONTAM: hypothetical protein K2H54_040710 [Gekko kuhli]